MCVTVVLPTTGKTMDDGAVAAWLAHTGDRVRKGQVIAQIETRLAAFDVEAPVAGVLRVLVRSEQTVPALTALAMVETDEPEEARSAYCQVREEAATPPVAPVAKEETSIRITTEPEPGQARPAGAQPPKSHLLSRLAPGGWGTSWA